MNDAVAPKFDLTPPSKDELRSLVADLSEDERHVLLEHGTEAAFCGVFLDEKREGVYTCRLCGLSSRPAQRSKRRRPLHESSPSASSWKALCRSNASLASGPLLQKTARDGRNFAGGYAGQAATDGCRSPSGRPS
jgi:hypothetical protein